MYAEDDMLMLSGIQHYMFCPRQWALIHIEQEWDENRLTTEGHLLHINVDNPEYRQKNGNTITLRSVTIASHKLGLYGVTDAVELLPIKEGENGIQHKSYPGIWKVYPIEYKRGKPKNIPVDKVQLVAQVMCFEEMYDITINEGAIFYGETRHREIVSINDELRSLVSQCAEDMHQIFKSNIIPKPNEGKHCRNCSLIDICIPKTHKCIKVDNYLQKYLYEETS